MERASQIKKLSDKGKIWDMVVVGGGATGLGVAVDAATRGMSVACLEKTDFAKCTSSRSTKLVHGGVRYLQKGDVMLVLEALRERGLLIQTDGQYPVLKLTQNARPVLLGEKSFEMRIPVPQEKAKKPDKAAGDADPELFARLKKLRAALAAKASVPAYVVFTDATLRDMCAKMPTDEQELLQVSGVGERKAQDRKSVV